MLRRSAFAWSLLLLSVAACSRVDDLREAFEHRTPHERYAAALREAGLAETALGQAWQEAAERALRTAPVVALPHREVGYLDPAEPSAFGYRVALERGQRLTVAVDRAEGDSTRLFVDLFELSDDSTRAPRHLASADSSDRLAHTARQARQYVVRVQPELLRGGRFTVTLDRKPSLRFPVAGHDSGAIGSRFGASRDGGRRQHHGVDIFAARGTPVVAAADGVVTRVQTGGLGGKVVWQRDRDGHALYYAHLDSQLTRPGVLVQAGDTLGLVGNTGNARTTPPHLHFGIYRSGPVDPYPFLHDPRLRPPAVAVDVARLGGWVRVAVEGGPLYAAAGREAAAGRRLPRHTPLRVAGGSGDRYRVVLPDGTTGYVAARATEGVEAPLRQAVLRRGQLLRRHPGTGATPVDSLYAGTTPDVLGRFDTFLLVRSPGGRTGWITAD